jgi:hypothetical protein
MILFVENMGGAFDHLAVRSVKVSSMFELVQEKERSYDAYLEYYKCIKQILWLCKFPFLTYWLITRPSLSLLSQLTNLLIGGELFLTSSGLILGCQMVMAVVPWPLLIVYSFHGALFGSLYYIEKNL